MRTLSLSAAAAALLLSAPAHAQDAAADTIPRTSLQKGTWSLSFLAPVYGGGGTGEFGVWEMVGSRTNVGLGLGVSVGGIDVEGDRDQTEALTAVSVGLNVRRYLVAPREVTPYLQGTASIGGSYQRREDSSGYEFEDRGVDGGLSAAVGVEWFPVRRMSVAGHTGFGIHTRRFEQHQEAPDGTEFDQDGSSLHVRSFTTALTLHIYF
ncbi:MAG TPA: hypothetical protein VHG08_28500 [Longimicrobium sp.]|nr:hypothetical protein [Longimicrobium sp.]